MGILVEIGSSETEIAVICSDGIIYSRHIPVAGRAMDRAVADYLREKHSLLVGKRTAEVLKIELGAASPLQTRLTAEVTGRSTLDKNRKLSLLKMRTFVKRLYMPSMQLLMQWLKQCKVCLRSYRLPWRRRVSFFEVKVDD
jgi:actin-like ATPase involved in cell morphogenesis